MKEKWWLVLFVCFMITVILIMSYEVLLDYQRQAQIRKTLDNGCKAVVLDSENLLKTTVAIDYFDTEDDIVNSGYVPLTFAYAKIFAETMFGIDDIEVLSCEFEITDYNFILKDYVVISVNWKIVGVRAVEYPLIDTTKVELKKYDDGWKVVS